MLRIIALSAFALACFSAPVLAQETPDPTGLWLTENKRSVIKVTRCGDSICGKVHWIIKDGMTVDSKNPDEKYRGKPMCGLQILSGFKNNPKNAKVWEGGQIYKADEGKVYTSTVSVTGPDSMNVRGYVGMPLFGKSQNWTRVTAKDYPACKK